MVAPRAGVTSHLCRAQFGERKPRFKNTKIRTSDTISFTARTAAGKLHKAAPASRGGSGEAPAAGTWGSAGKVPKAGVLLSRSARGHPYPYQTKKKNQCASHWR